MGLAGSARLEYVGGEPYANTVEGFFSLLKRGINGVYHHVSRGHLDRYCDKSRSATSARARFHERLRDLALRPARARGLTSQRE